MYRICSPFYFHYMYFFLIRTCLFYANISSHAPKTYQIAVIVTCLRTHFFGCHLLLRLENHKITIIIITILILATPFRFSRQVILFVVRYC
jgi:hypothetical protein